MWPQPFSLLLFTVTRTALRRVHIPQTDLENLLSFCLQWHALIMPHNVWPNDSHSHCLQWLTYLPTPAVYSDLRILITLTYSVTSASYLSHMYCLRSDDTLVHSLYPVHSDDTPVDCTVYERWHTCPLYPVHSDDTPIHCTLYIAMTPCSLYSVLSDDTPVHCTLYIAMTHLFTVPCT